jgi:hypothetical protein
MMGFPSYMACKQLGSAPDVTYFTPIAGRLPLHHPTRPSESHASRPKLFHPAQ